MPTDETVDQKARDGVMELKGDLKLTAAQVLEARNDIARLDAAFMKSGDERKAQFRWLMTLLVSIALGVAGMIFTVVMKH